MLPREVEAGIAWLGTWDIVRLEDIIARKSAHVVMPFPRANVPTWKWLGARRVIVRFSVNGVSNVIARRSPTTKNLSQVYAVRYGFAPFAGDL